MDADIVTAADLSCHVCSNAWEWKAGFPLFSHLLILVYCIITNVSISRHTIYQLLNVVFINMYLLQEYLLHYN